MARDNDGKSVLDDKVRPVYEVTKLERQWSDTHTVFNAERATGLPPRPLRNPGHQWERNARVEKLIKNCGAALGHNNQDRVYYGLGRDLIVLPYSQQFPNSAGYCQSVLRELGHWTGHPERMNRESLVGGIRQGPRSLEYSLEELRAEISPLVTGDQSDVGHDGSRTAAYGEHWVKTSKDHPKRSIRRAVSRRGSANTSWSVAGC